jgi:hypothetical protein
MESSIDFRRATGQPAANMASVAAMGQPTFITTPCHWVRFIVCCDRAG